MADYGSEDGGSICLPAGTLLRDLTTHRDARGNLTEVFRQSWQDDLRPVQWNLSRSGPGVLRGVHVHPRHTDYLIVVEGLVSVGLSDLRQGSPTRGLGALFEMSGDSLAALAIPTGVAHGFYFHRASIHLYATSHYWDPADELACQWDDPGLHIAWPFTAPILSERDAQAPALSALGGLLPPYSPR